MLGMTQYSTTPRIGSVTVRHSRERVSERLGSGYYYNRNGSDIQDKQKPERYYTESSEQDEDKNWSLVELLSRSGSAVSFRRPTSAFLSGGGHDPYSGQHVKQETARYSQSGTNSTGGTRLWRRPDPSTRRDYPISESYEETENEGSEYFRPISSGSSISWADDAMEFEHSENLAKFWRDVEAVCSGGSRPDKMSVEVHEECQLWRRAFPDETSSSRPSRFESMEQFLTVIDQEELSPTNDDARTVTGDGDNHNNRFTMKICHGQIDNSLPNSNETTDLVTSWLSNCKIRNDNTTLNDDYCKDDDNEIQGPNKSARVTSSQLLLQTNSRSLTVPEFPKGSPSQQRFMSSPCLPRKSSEQHDLSERDCTGTMSTPGRRNDLWILNTEHQNTSQRPLFLQIPPPEQRNTISGQNSRKPFLFWVFDRVSPTQNKD